MDGWNSDKTNQCSNTTIQQLGTVKWQEDKTIRREVLATWRKQHYGNNAKADNTKREKVQGMRGCSCNGVGIRVGVLLTIECLSA